MNKPKTVDEYIASAPKEVQAKLKEIREAIRLSAPKAEEKISYGMPYYGYNGRVVYFAYAKKHIGLYIPPPIVQQYAKELDRYVTAKAAIQFPLGEKIPLTLIKKMVRVRVKMNEEK